MHQLPLLVSLGLLAACGESASTPDNDIADNDSVISAAETVDDSPADISGEPASAVPEARAEAEKPTTAEKSTVLSSLPLKRGYYVAGDTACGQASNATLMLVTRDGINSSRIPCEFKKIEKTGANSYRVTDSCSEGGPAWGTEEHISTNVTIYEIKGDATFTSKSDSGWENSAQYCPQASLPEPWRNNDISDSIK